MLQTNFVFLQAFEQRLSEYTGAPYVVLVDSCTNALFLSLVAQGIKNTEIIVPDRTYVGVYNSIVHSKNTPKLIDNVWRGCYRLGDTNIWDCAVGFVEGMYVPGQLMCLSFQQKKAIKIGKGGAILLDDRQLYEKISRLSFDGRDYKINYADDSIRIGGYHMNMTPEDAAKGILLLNQYTFDQRDIKCSTDYKRFTI